MTDVRPLLVESVRRHGLSGVAVALVRKGEPPEFVCVGPADRATGRPLAPDTVFHIASISKTMTAIGLMQLRDQGLFALDDPVNSYLRHLTIAPPPGGPPVTFRHLLTHTAGIGEVPRLTDLVRREIWGMGRPGTAPADLARVYGGTVRAELAAGSKWAYANHGFVVLGQLVEDISGRPFAEHMYEHLFGPLRVPSTEYTRTERTQGNVATGYNWVFGRMRTVKDYDLTSLGAGAVLSSLADMATYAAWLAGKGAGRRGVLKAATLAEMMTPHHTIDPRLPGTGLAFALHQYGPHRVVGHDGNNPGFASALLVAPDDGVAVVVLTNTATLTGANLLAGTLLRSLLGQGAAAPALPRPDVASLPLGWPELVGPYAPGPGFLTNLRSWYMVGGEVQVVVRKRRLTLQALSPFPQLRRGVELHRTDEDDPLRFAFELDGLVVAVVFGRDGTGEVDRVVLGRPLSATFHRRATWRGSRLRLRLAAATAVVAALARIGRGRRR